MKKLLFALFITAAMTITQPAASVSLSSRKITAPPDMSAETAYLTVCNLSYENKDAILRYIKNADIPALFWMTESEIRNSPALVREIIVSGYRVGIMLTEETYDEFERAGDLLFEAAYTVSDCVSVRGSLTNSAERRVDANDIPVVFGTVTALRVAKYNVAPLPETTEILSEIMR